jgi:ammonia channel protein AmtB
MGILGSLFYPWGLLLQGVAFIHFIRRRPDTYWIFIIIFLGPVGALIYIFAEALPDLGLLRQSFKGFPRRKRIAQLIGIAALLGLILPLAYLLLALLNPLVPFRVDPDGERIGMDLHELGGGAYPEFVIHRDESYR